MQNLAFAQLFCCLVLVLDVGDTKAESSTEAGTDASEGQQLSSALIIIKELEEEMAAMAKNSAKEREETNKRTDELLKEIRRERQNKDSKINKKTKRQFNELQECKRREAKRLKDAVNPKSANGSLPNNSSRMDADNLKRFCKAPKTCPVAKTCQGPTLQKFKIDKTWSEARSHCKSLGGDLATFPNSTQLVRAEEQTGDVHNNRWIGGHCEGAEGECHRGEQRKQWKWIGGGEISYDLKYWHGYPNGEPDSFHEPGCLYMNGGPENKQMLVARNCEAFKFHFLCQF